MAAYVIFDVEIRDMNQYQVFMQGVKPAVEAFESFYNGSVCRDLKPGRDACSSARLVAVEGLA